MIAFVCGTEQEADWLQLRFAGATGSDMIFVTPFSAPELSGYQIAGYIVTDLAHKLAAGSPEFRDRLHRVIHYCEVDGARATYGF